MKCDPSPRLKKFVIVLMLVLALAVVLGGCAHEDPWTRRDTIGQVFVTAALAADAYTTARIQDCWDCYERGPLARPILGSHPGTSETYVYFGTAIITHYLISRALPSQWRPYWQGVNFAIHTIAVINNCELDLGC